MKCLLGSAFFTIALLAVSAAIGGEGLGGMLGMTGMAGMAGPSQTSRYAKQKVVYHIDFYGAEKEADALGTIQDHIDAVGAQNLDLKVVLEGDGVALLLEPNGLVGSKMKEANATEEVQAKISDLKGAGVTFDICSSTLKSRNIDKAYLYDFSDADIVPSGVAELAHLQAQGYAYIKP